MKLPWIKLHTNIQIQEIIFEQCVRQRVPNTINVYFWKKKSNHSILEHILYLFHQCHSAHNSIYFQATPESTILTLHNCYEIRAFIFNRTRREQYLTYLLKAFNGNYSYFKCQFMNLNGKTNLSKCVQVAVKQKSQWVVLIFFNGSSLEYFYFLTIVDLN